MPSLWLIDETPIETRLARLIGGRLALIRHYPKVGAAAHEARPGDVFAARVRAKSASAGGRFLDLGEAGVGFLREGSELVEGALIVATVVQAPFGHKAPRLVLGTRGPDDCRPGEISEPRRLARAPDAVRTVMAHAKAGDRIRISGSAALLRGASAAAEDAAEIGASIEAADVDLFESEGAETMIEQAIEPIVPLECGGRLIIETTEALTAVDIDSASAPSAEHVSLESAELLPFEIAAREIAGTVIIDFPAVRERPHLQRLADRIKAGARAIDLDLDVGLGHRGLLDIRRPRVEAPLATRLTNAGVTHLSVRPVLKRSAQAARLARELARRTPASRREARVPPSLALWLEGEGADYREAILRAAPALRLVADPALEPDGFEIGS